MLAKKKKSILTKGDDILNGYGAFSVSQSNLDEVIRYIENQEEHHKSVTSRTSVVRF